MKTIYKTKTNNNLTKFAGEYRTEMKMLDTGKKVKWLILETEYIASIGFERNTQTWLDYFSFMRENNKEKLAKEIEFKKTTIKYYDKRTTEYKLFVVNLKQKELILKYWDVYQAFLRGRL